MKLFNDQRNAKVFSFIYLFTSALHVSGFLLAHLQKQAYYFGSPSADTIPSRLEPLPKLYTCP
jgi:CRISPR/Cas system endoribonuclease Cas6 (RAMP superfamily)